MRGSMKESPPTVWRFLVGTLSAKWHTTATETVSCQRVNVTRSPLVCPLTDSSTLHSLDWQKQHFWWIDMLFKHCIRRIFHFRPNETFTSDYSSKSDIYSCDFSTWHTQSLCQSTKPCPSDKLSRISCSTSSTKFLTSYSISQLLLLCISLSLLSGEFMVHSSLNSIINTHFAKLFHKCMALCHCHYHGI